jgi:hypothetical protein
VAIGKLGGRPKGSKNRKPLNPLADLSPQKALYVQSRLKGLTKAESARAAGYSEATAKSPTRLETRDVKEAFRQMMAQAIPAEKIVERVKEGLSSTKVIYGTNLGRIVDTKEIPDYSERRKYAMDAAQFSGRWNPKAEVEVNGMSDETVQRLIAISERLGIADLPFEERRELRRSHVPLMRDANVTIDAETITTETTGEDENH